MNKKKIITGVVIVAIVLVVISLMKTPANNSLNRDVLQELTHEESVFKVSYEEPKASFGSGHKILSVHDTNGDLLDEVMFGDHPLVLESVDGDKINIVVPITFYERNDIDYINSWLDKNKSIGEYSIEYRIFNDPATSSEDFKYPR